jgi:hypothetical protein
MDDFYEVSVCERGFLVISFRQDIQIQLYRHPIPPHVQSPEQFGDGHGFLTFI